MASRKPDPTPIELYLAPLAPLLRKQPEIEGLVFWGSAEGWSDTPAEALESEEITFWAEGLLDEGFHMRWSVLAIPGDSQPDHIRLHVWQDGAAPPPPEDWTLLSQADWTPDDL